MKNEPKHSILKLVIVSGLCLAALAFAILQIIGATSRNIPDMQVAGAQETRFSQERRPERRSERRFNRTEFREELNSRLNLTKEQEEAMAEIRKNMETGDRSQRFEQMRAMREVLTPEQQETMRSSFRERMGNRMGNRMRGRMERLQRVLPPRELEKFMKKLEERHERFRGRSGRPPRRGM